ncbi:MAG TPA: hypothetical protein VHW66_21010 [Stellaceae bacterium]|jgi:hypothetical protein|nr:hypothetical protein [Stellaceae bacterium]
MPERVKVKRSMPSLIGGIFTGFVVLALWLLLVGSGFPLILVGLLLAIGVGWWIRMADL